MSVERITMPADQETIAAWHSHFAEPVLGSENMLTAAELAELANIGVREMQRRLKIGVNNGTYAVAKAYRTNVTGQHKITPVYKLVGKPKPKRGKK